MIGETLIAPVLAPVVRPGAVASRPAAGPDHGAGGLLVVLIVAGSVILLAVLPYRYDQQSLDHTLDGPSRQHWLGTDQYGRTSSAWRREDSETAFADQGECVEDDVDDARREAA